MTATRDELHRVVDQLPEEQLSSALEQLRAHAARIKRERAIAALERARTQLHDVAGVDEEIDRIRDSSRV